MFNAKLFDTEPSVCNLFCPGGGGKQMDVLSLWLGQHVYANVSPCVNGLMTVRHVPSSIDFSAPPVFLALVLASGRLFVTVVVTAGFLVSSRILYEVVRTGKYA